MEEAKIVVESDDGHSSLSTSLHALKSCPIKKVNEITGSAISVLAKLDEYATKAAELDTNLNTIVTAVRPSNMGSVQEA